MTDDVKKFAVFGVLAHELCHLAVYMAFMNRNFDPFQVGASANKTRFLQRVMFQCKEREEAEGIVANVFNSYDKDVQDSEMIVTVPQMLMQYVNNAGKIQELEGIFEELFSYCREVVEPELDKALPVLKILADFDKTVKFPYLTDPMKSKILHSKIIFQGSETTFNDLIGNDEEVLKLLTSGDIKNILMKNHKLKIGKVCELNLKYGLTERFFVDSTIDCKFKRYFNVSEIAENQQTAEQIREKTKIFILADHAGTGKTTIFKNWAIKLKRSYPNLWIFFISLRKCAEIFKKLPFDRLDREMVLQMLIEIVNPSTELEKKIFRRLYAAGQNILLFDGVDEICPKYTKIFTEIFKILLNNGVKNEFWLSTRPHYAVKLAAFFQTSSYKLVRLSVDKMKNFIQKILEVNKVPDDQEFELFGKIINCIRNLESNWEDIDNPLMIQMITELHISSEHVIDTNNRYKLFELMIEQQKREIGEKIPIEDHDRDSKLTVWDVHRILALELIIGDDLQGIKLENLTLFKKWKKEKKNWTSDMIQRYGFVVVDLNDDSLDTAIDFMHRTWAEFFVAQFLLNFIFDDDKDMNDMDAKNVVNLLDLILNDNGSLSKIKEFIHSFLMYEVKNHKIHKKIKKLLLKKITKLHKNRDYFDGCDGLKSYALIGCIDADIFKMFWKCDKKVNLLEEFVFNCEIHIFHELIESKELSVFPNWHETFNKSSTKLITDQEIEKFPRNAELDRYWIEDKNRLKFFDYVDKNFKIKIRQKIYEPSNLELGHNSKIQMEIIQKYRNNFGIFETVGLCLVHFNYYFISFEALSLAFELFEEAFAFNHEAINYFLFCHPHKIAFNLTTPPIEWPSPIVRAFESKNSQIFNFVKDFFMKYKNSMSDIQNSILNSPGKDLIYPVDSLFYTEYKALIAEVFGADKSKIAANIENYINKDTKGSYTRRNEKNLKDLLLFIFEDEEKAMNMLEKLSWPKRN